MAFIRYHPLVSTLRLKQLKDIILELGEISRNSIQSIN